MPHTSTLVSFLDSILNSDGTATVTLIRSERAPGLVFASYGGAGVSAYSTETGKEAGYWTVGVDADRPPTLAEIQASIAGLYDDTDDD